MTPQKLSILIGILVVAGGIGFLIAKRSQVSDSTVVIRSYSVPPAQARSIQWRLNQIFESEKGGGSAQLFNEGTLAVKAPVSYQRGISHLLELMPKEKASSRSIQFDYWLVRAENSGSAGTSSYAVIGPALEAIQKTQGNKKFTVIDHLSFKTLAEREVAVSGGIAQIKAKSQIMNDAVDAQLEVRTYHDAVGKIDSSTRFKSGEVIVLGQMLEWKDSGEVARGRAEANSKDVFHIIRAEIIP